MRILVVKTTSMGDIVHTLPAVSDISAAIPGVQIDWLVEQPFAAIAALHPAVARVIPIQFRKWRKRFWAADVRAMMRVRMDELHEHPYDWIIDFQGLLKSALFARAAKGRSAATVAGFDRASAREPLASWFYERRAAVPRQMQAVERSRLLAALHLNISVNGPPRFGIDAHLDRCAHTWCPAGPYAVLMPAASRIEKLWPFDDWVAVAGALKDSGLAVVVMWGSKEEHARAQRLADACGAAVPPFLTVADAAGLLAGAHVVIGLDTGFTHLAAALGRPTIGIYCDHDPGLAGLTGAAFTASLGGKGAPPSRAVVLDAMQQAMACELEPHA
jgi:heptosyltransferase I